MNRVKWSGAWLGYVGAVLVCLLAAAMLIGGGIPVPVLVTVG